MAVRTDEMPPQRAVSTLSALPLALGEFLRKRYRWIVHAIGLLPLALIVTKALTSGLTANPIQFLTFRTGKAALILVILTLACTPINTILHIKESLKARRTLGLYTFFYVCLHLSIFVVLDYGFDFRQILDIIREKRYILAGLGAFLVFLPLAITSFGQWKKRLGKNWKRLHRFIYLGAMLAVVHYVWEVKSDIRVPLLYGAGIAILLVLRIPPVRKFLSNLSFRRSA